LRVTYAVVQIGIEDAQIGSHDKAQGLIVGCARLPAQAEGGKADRARSRDGRDRRRDLVRGLLRVSGDEAKRTGRQSDRDIAIGVLIVENGAVEFDGRAGTERQIGAVGHHQPRRAVETGAHDFVAEHAVTDIDLAARRSHDADDFIFDDGRFGDAGLRVRGACGKNQLRRTARKYEERKNAKLISNTARSIYSHRTGPCVHAIL